MLLSCTECIFSVDGRVPWRRLQRVLSLRGSVQRHQCRRSGRGAARVGGCGPRLTAASPAAACPASAAPSLATGASTATCARTTPPTAPSWRAASTRLRYGAAGRGRRCRGAVCGVLARGLSRPGTVAGGVGWWSPLGGCTPKARPGRLPSVPMGGGLPRGRNRLGRGAGVRWFPESP